METKLKALKVVDLKLILSSANQHHPAKAIKSDLIARIVASTAALDAYRAIHEPDPSAVPVASSSVIQINSFPNRQEPTPIPPFTQRYQDPELEKRIQRAARFGIPLIETPEPSPQSSSLSGDAEKCSSRAARFGITGPNPEILNRKQAPQQEQMDLEELERRRKRAERFGLTPSATITKI